MESEVKEKPPLNNKIRHAQGVPPASRLATTGESIQVNSCRNPLCANFGRDPVVPTIDGGYALNTHYKPIVRHRDEGDIPVIQCLVCGSQQTLRSNEGVADLIEGLLAEEIRILSCKNCGTRCEERDMSGKFIKHGTTPTGVPRYRCLLCKDRGLKSTCAVEESSRQDPKAGLARDRCSRFRALLNGGHMRGTARTFRGKDSKWPWRTYTDLDFFARIFRNWRRLHNERIRSGEIDLSAAREFGDGGKGGADEKGEAGTTRNKHVIHDEQITVVTDIMSLALRTPGGHDNHEPLNLIISTLRPSHYVLAATPMFDGSVNWEDVLNSQMGLGGAHHLWPNAQYYGLGDVFRSKLRYESESEQRKYTPPLTGGLKVRDPYMLHAHFFLLRKLLSWSPMVVHYMDGEEVLGNACLWAFKDQIIAGRCEVLQVTSHRKGLEGAIDAQEDARRVAKQTDRGRANYDELLTIARESRSWRHGEGKPPATKKEKTFPVPLISKLDGMRSVTYLTETGVRSDREVVDLVLGASVTDVDGEIGWFRERVDFVSRAAHAAGTGTLSYKKNLGSPEVLQKIVAAYMFSKNNLWDHYQEDWVTPAAKLGLLKTPVSTEDLLDHPIGPHEY